MTHAKVTVFKTWRGLEENTTRVNLLKTFQHSQKRLVGLLTFERSSSKTATRS